MSQFTLQVPDNIYQDISAYLFSMVKLKDRIYLLANGSVIMPIKIIAYPKNKFFIQYNVNIETMGSQRFDNILNQLKMQNKKLNYQDLFHILKEIVLIMIILQRNNINIIGISPQQIYVNLSNGSIKFLLIDENLFLSQYTSFYQRNEYQVFDQKSEVKQIRYRQISNISFINQIYQHSQLHLENIKAIKLFEEFVVNVSQYSLLQEDQNGLINLVFTKFIYNNNLSFSQILCKHNFIEHMLANAQNQQLIQYCATLINNTQQEQIFLYNIFNPFQNQNAYLQTQLTLFLNKRQIKQIISFLIIDQQNQSQLQENYVQNQIDHFIYQILEQDNNYQSLQSQFMNGDQNADKQKNEQVYVVSNSIKFQQLCDKIVIIKQEKQYQKLFQEVLLQIQNYCFRDQICVFKVSTVDQYVNQLLDYIKQYPHNTILDTNTTLVDLLFDYYYSNNGQINPKTKKRLIDPQLEDIFQISFEDYNTNCTNETQTKFNEKCQTYIYRLNECAQYLGQIFPEFLQILNIQPDISLDIFDCLTGGLYLLMLTRYIIKPNIKITFIFNELEIVQSPPLDRNLLQAMIVSLNDEITPNTQIFYFQDTEKSDQINFTNQNQIKYDKIQKQIRFHIVQNLKCKKQDIIIQEQVIDQTEVVKQSINQSNQLEIEYFVTQIINNQCEKKNFYCFISIIKQCILNNSMFFISEETLNNQFNLFQKQQLTNNANLIEPAFKDCAYSAIRQSLTIIKESTEYLNYIKPCYNKLLFVFDEILQEYNFSRYKNIRTVLLTCCLLTRGVTVIFLSEILNLQIDEIQAICEILQQQRLLTYINEEYIVTDLHQVKEIIQSLKCDDIWYVADLVFNYLVQEHQLLDDIDNFIVTNNYSLDLQSQIWRLFRCFDICDKIQSQIPVLQQNKNLEKYIVKQNKTNIVYMDDNSSQFVQAQYDKIINQNENDEQTEDENDNDLIMQFSVKGQKKQSLETALGKDQIRSDILKISGLLIRIKTSLMVINCLSLSNQNNFLTNASKSYQQDDNILIFLVNNAHYIQYIVTRTKSLIQTLQQLINKSIHLKIYNNIFIKLKLQYKWYQFMNLPLYNMQSDDSLTQLFKQNMSPLGLSVIAWRLIKAGNITEALAFSLTQLKQTLLQEDMYQIYTQIYKHHCGYVQYQLMYQIYGNIMKYYYIFRNKDELKQTDYPYMEAMLLVECIIACCRINGNILLMQSLCITLLNFCKSYGYFKQMNVILLVAMNFLMEMFDSYNTILYDTQIYQQLEGAFNDVLLQTLEQLDDISNIRTRYIISNLIESEEQIYDQITKQQNDQNNQQYQNLCISLVDSYSFTSINEILLLSHKFDEPTLNQLTSTLLNMSQQATFSLGQQYTQTQFDNVTLLRLNLIMLQFLQHVNFDVLYQHQNLFNLQQQLEYFIRISEFLTEAKIYSIMLAIINSFDILQSPPCKISIMKYPHQKINCDKTMEMLVDLFENEESCCYSFSIIVLQTMLLIHSMLRKDDLMVKYLMQCFQRNIHVFKCTFYFDLFQQLNKIYLSSGHNNQDEIEQLLVNSNSNFDSYLFLVLRFQKYSNDQIFDLLMRLQFKYKDNIQINNIIHKLTINNNKSFLCRVGFKQREQIQYKPIKNIAQRQIQEMENLYGFLYYWNC